MDQVRKVPGGMNQYKLSLVAIHKNLFIARKPELVYHPHPKKDPLKEEKAFRYFSI
jgi:hypothetical protein